MKHIDVPGIVTRPTTRFRFLKDFVGYTEDDRRAMTESLVLLGARLPRILDDLYDHLLDHDDTRRVFLGPAGELDPLYIAQRKEHLTEWVLMAAAGPVSDDFAAFLVKLASQHLGAAAGSEHRAVPPRYIVAVTSRIQTAILEALFDALPGSPELALRAALAWNKFLMVQLELFLHVIAPSWPHWDEIRPVETRSFNLAGSAGA
jgi:hypothetical protein